MFLLLVNSWGSLFLAVCQVLYDIFKNTPAKERGDVNSVTTTDRQSINLVEKQNDVRDENRNMIVLLGEKFSLSLKEKEWGYIFFWRRMVALFLR